MTRSSGRDHNRIVTWLFIGVVMVFVQILVGGVTRLTGSGLSITKWDIITGTIPPLTHAQWEEAFAQYRETPQYRQINQGMSLGQFTFIYFWEYIHRLWARSMGFVFLIPFLFFLFRRSLQRATLLRLFIVIFIASLAALFGWIMVASGLISRPWVNAYKLTVHLALGISLFLYLFYTWIREKGYSFIPIQKKWRSLFRVLLVLVVIQVLLGGLVSGMKAALNYPTWPLMGGDILPGVLLDKSHWHPDTFLFYDQSVFMPALVQFLHRNMAYLILLISLYFGMRWIKEQPSHLHWVMYGWLGIIVVQVVLGILTLLQSIGSIPVLQGSLHQGVGILVITYLVFINLRIKENPMKN